jgi:hypothetical protein
MSTNDRPRPSLAVLQWIDKHTGNAEAAVHDYQAFEYANALGNRIGRAVHLTENVAGNLARGTIGRRQAVDMLRELHQMIFELGRDLEPGFPPQSREQWRWDNAADGLSPWQPSAINSENSSYGNKPEEGVI